MAFPIVNSFASFLTARANEQIYNNATENTKIIYLSLYAGLLPAGAGKSHQSLRDISALSSIPNMKIFHPLNYKETAQFLNIVLKEKYNSSIRLNIGPPPTNIKEMKKKINFKYGRGSELIKGKDILIFGYGQYLIDEAIKASKILNKQISCNLINMSSINSFDLKWLKNKVKKYYKILILDDHNIVGGLGDTLISFLTVNNLIKNKKVKKLGVTEFPKCGSKEEVLKHHKLDGLSISKVIRNL